MISHKLCIGHCFNDLDIGDDVCFSNVKFLLGMWLRQRFSVHLVI